MKHDTPNAGKRAVWDAWNDDEHYASLMKRRATGELPEMESSKALAGHLKNLLVENSEILDVGCGVGHYLRTLRGTFGGAFKYTGIDGSDLFVKTARQTWENDPNASFKKGDIFDIPVQDRFADITTCCNVLLHLPSIRKPLGELIRTARKHIVIRTLIGTRSLRIQEVYSPESHPHLFKDAALSEFDEEGNPRSFNFYNIYSKGYVERILSERSDVKDVHFVEDRDFSEENILRAEKDASTYNATTIINGRQVNGYILQPWMFVHIEKN